MVSRAIPFSVPQSHSHPPTMLWESFVVLGIKAEWGTVKWPLDIYYSFNILAVSCHSLLVYTVSSEKSVNLKGGGGFSYFWLSLFALHI